MIFKTITDDTTKATKSIGLFGISLKNDVLPKLSNLKTSIKEIKDNGFANTFKGLFKKVNTSSIDGNAIQNYNQAIEEAINRNADFSEKQQIMQNAMKGTNKATANLIASTNGATISTEALSAAQKATTISSRALAVGLKLVSTAGNIIIYTLIAKGISAIVESIDNYIHKSEKAIEKADELKSSMSETIATINSKEKSLESLSDRFIELSKGVDEYGNIISLTNEETEEYKELVEKLIELNPLIVKGYTAEGDAIIDKNTALSDTIALLEKEKQLELEKAMSVENLQSIGKGALEKYNEKLGSEHTGQWKKYDLDTVSGQAANFGTEAAKIFDEESIKAFYEYTNSRPQEKIYGKSSWLKAFGIHTDDIDYDLESYLQNNIDVFAEHMDEILKNPNMERCLKSGAIERFVELIRQPSGERTFFVYNQKGKKICGK